MDEGKLIATVVTGGAELRLTWYQRPVGEALAFRWWRYDGRPMGVPLEVPGTALPGLAEGVAKACAEANLSALSDATGSVVDVDGKAADDDWLADMFESDAPEDRAFCRWLTHDVLPQIRRTGAYRPSDAPEGVIPVDPKRRREMRERLTGLLGPDLVTQLFGG